MKSLLIIPVLLLPACVSHPPRKVAVVGVSSPARLVGADGLRTVEQLREYRFGRYVDPGDPLVMHDSHPVYRVETSENWNLRPSGAIPPAPRMSASAPSISANDAVVAEVNKQRAATRAVTEQAATLNQRLGEMTQAAAQSQELVRQALGIKRDLATLQERINSLDERLSERRAPSPDGPPARTEDKW